MPDQKKDARHEKPEEVQVPDAESTTPAPKEKRGRKPGPARQTLLDAAEGKETMLTFTTSELAKGSAYGWWGSRRRAGLTDRVAIHLDTTAMTVTIGPRKADAAPDESSEPTAGAPAQKPAEPGTDEAAETLTQEDGGSKAPPEESPTDMEREPVEEAP